MPALSPKAAEFVGLMKRLRWSQSETARQLFITPAHVNQIARGRAEPSAAMVQLLRLTALQQGLDPGTAAETRAAAAPDALETFWTALRRRKLDKMSRERQAEFVRAWSVILGLPDAGG